MTKARSNATAPAAKGEIVVGTGTDASGVLSVGSANQVLTVDSSTATGLKWAAPFSAGKNWTLVSSLTLSGAATRTISGISGADQIFITIEAASSENASAEIRFRINSDSGANYYSWGFRNIAGATYNAANFQKYERTGFNELVLAKMANVQTSSVSGFITISGANSSGVKILTLSGGPAGADSGEQIVQGGYWNNSATVTEVSLISSTGNFDLGTMRVWTTA